MSPAAESSSKGNPLNWLDQYGDFLFSYAQIRLRDAAAAEDVVQETFLAAIEQQNQYSGAGEERAWLLGILKRKIIDSVRRRMRTGSKGTGDPGEDISSRIFDEKGNWRQDPRFASQQPETGLEHEEFMTALRGCLDGLPRRQADVFILRELDEMETENICKELDLTSSNLWVLLHRARMRLSDCLRARWLK